MVATFVALVVPPRSQPGRSDGNDKKAARPRSRSGRVVELASRQT
ncbi:hypothetical protein [Streptomyces sp. NPDC008150]